jgi:UDP-N-acetylmuramyl-tripeptide synthetase
MQAFTTPFDASDWLKQQCKGSLTADSRQLASGDGFIAWPGSVTDARQFVPGALASGATACLVEREGADATLLSGHAVASYDGLKRDTGRIAAAYFGFPSTQISVLAITGTNGKTSTAWWLAQALTTLPLPYALPCGLIGTLGVGCPSVAPLVETGMTTPDPVFLQKTLLQFVSDGLGACAIEASSIGIAEHRLDGVQIRTAVFTNFTQDHLDYHQDMDAYWQAKRSLFNWPGLRSAVINVDDEKGAELADSLDRNAVDLWTVSVAGGARINAQNIGYAAQGMQFDVEEDGAVVPLQVSMIGTYNVSNLLGVVATLRSLGVPLQEAVDVCRNLQPVPGRMEFFGGEGQPLVAVDYAHTPDALAKAIQALRPMAHQRGGRVWCVFGCGGDRDASKRPLMGAVAAQHADSVIVTSDNPRSEKPEAIIAQILLGITHNTSVEVQINRAQAIHDAVARAQSCDVILLAGKGHETTQEMTGTKTSFDDRLQAVQALEQRQ